MSSIVVLVILLTASAGSAGAQGCAQCRSGVEQGSAKTQSAYRHGIEALVAAGICASAVGVMVVRRFR